MLKRKTERKDLCYEGLFGKPLTQLCRWSWCLYIMCICTLTSHSNYTACPCAVALCTRPFALEKCVWFPVSLEALASDCQTIDTDHQGALLTWLVPKCCPRSCHHISSSRITLCQLNTRHLPIFQSLRLDVSFCWRFQSEYLRYAQMCMHPASITRTAQLFCCFHVELT